MMAALLKPSESSTPVSCSRLLLQRVKIRVRIMPLTRIITASRVGSSSLRAFKGALALR